MADDKNKKKRFNPRQYDLAHLQAQYDRAKAIEAKYNEVIAEAQRIAESTGFADAEKEFKFEDYPSAQKRMDDLMSDMSDYLTTTIEEGDKDEWQRSTLKNDAMVDYITANTTLSAPQLAAWKQSNLMALAAFQQRKIEGMGLSKRVWNLTDQLRQELELALDLGLGEGKSAAALSRDVRQYLNEPNRLFRRVRDKHGVLRLSKAAKAYHPGRGVYRSSYKNALRLTATENNMAYRTADHLRWQQMPFVIGIEIKLSNNHTCKGVIGRFMDICDDLAGVYPKEFKFVGWHPHCRCFAIAKMASDKECNDYFDRLEAGEDVSNYEFSGKVKELPQNFQNWHTDNADRIAKAKSQPYFLRDNQKLIEKSVNSTKTYKLDKYIKELKDKNIEYNQVKQLDKLLSDEEIIKRVGGGDMTSGSCSSAALAYIANDCGFDVLDFRGGESLDYFSEFLNLMNIVDNMGGYSSFETSHSALLKHTEIGKKYYLGYGRHAAIVKKVAKKEFQYLELQSPTDNGWKDLNGYVFRQRFDGVGKQFGFVIDIKQLQNDEKFKDLMGYINTKETMQKKGLLGRIK